MKLEDIGFYTLEDKRASQVSSSSPLWRCEMLLTSRCNFNCTYCRKRSAPDITEEKAFRIVDYWISEELRNVRFSGGEPTLCSNLLLKLVQRCREGGVKRIAISTNGSANCGLYQKLIDLGVNDFSISLDACCASTGDSIAGVSSWDHVTQIIQFVSRQVYTTVGVVVTEKNMDELPGTIQLAKSLGVHDVRIISAAQWNKPLEISNLTRSQYPILNYRISNMEKERNVRGIKGTDNHKCPLVLDDMAVEEDYHYPCIIYMREIGKPIGKISENTRKEREEWFRNHNCFEDNICRKNCLDVCVDYNNRVRELAEIQK